MNVMEEWWSCRLLGIVLAVVFQATTVHATLHARPSPVQLTVAHDDFLHTATPTSASASCWSHSQLPPLSFQPKPNSPDRTDGLDPLEALRDALDVMQTTWFELWVGTWTTTIDWTGAVMNTHVVAALNSLSKALHTDSSSPTPDQRIVLENEIDRYFTQSVAYYFGENAFAIRNEAYDDMLWVVLGWLEGTKFIDAHSRKHRGYNDESRETWHGRQFTSAFAHRSHVFYSVAAKGWDTELCGGGMIWNPTLEPYKNAITNELFIAASVGMYLYFPGDSNTSPFVMNGIYYSGLEPALPHDPSYLNAAIEGYSWLKNSNMTNDQGLYVDGFHISGWHQDGLTSQRVCDARNEMVYSYNQGVLLSGLRGLWESTGKQTYLEDGHELIRNVISATGWQHSNTLNNGQWAGLGRDGILEDYCDHRGSCDQDGQAFKGIFFHHLTLFCALLPSEPLVPGKTHTADKYLGMLHRRSCEEYSDWVAHNAHAAIKTRDAQGRFGSWWGFDTPNATSVSLPAGAVDYRNDMSSPRDGRYVPQDLLEAAYGDGILPATVRETMAPHGGIRSSTSVQDPNDRGRGRTVEAQGSGVALLHSLVELLSVRR